MIHRRTVTTLAAINDFVCVYRYQGLVPSPKVEAWLERGQAVLAGDGATRTG